MGMSLFGGSPARGSNRETLSGYRKVPKKAGMAEHSKERAAG